MVVDRHPWKSTRHQRAKAKERDRKAKGLPREKARIKGNQQTPKAKVSLNRVAKVTMPLPLPKELARISHEALPEGLDDARKSTTFMDPIDMTDECKSRGRQLFAICNSWMQALTVATKIARGIREQNGWEFWRLLWRELAPDNHSRSLVWRRALLGPKFPNKETDF